MSCGARELGYRDYPEKRDPAAALKSARIGKKDRPVTDPFSIQEAERLIAALHRDWEEAQGNYDEFRLFTGLRPSEQIALVVADCDAEKPWAMSIESRPHLPTAASRPVWQWIWHWRAAGSR